MMTVAHSGEEADTHALLKDILRFTGGILEPEASAMAVRFCSHALKCWPAHSEPTCS